MYVLTLVAAMMLPKPSPVALLPIDPSIRQYVMNWADRPAEFYIVTQSILSPVGAVGIGADIPHPSQVPPQSAYWWYWGPPDERLRDCQSEGATVGICVLSTPGGTWAWRSFTLDLEHHYGSWTNSKVTPVLIVPLR